VIHAATVPATPPDRNLPRNRRKKEEEQQRR
jgi:hypothetical protein